MHKVSLTLICVIALAICSGCASMKHNYVPSVKQLDFPGVNTITTVYMGDAMLIQGSVMETEVLDNKSLIDGACYKIPMGLYPKNGSDDKKNYFSAIGDRGQVARSGLCDPISGLFVSQANDEVCVITVFGAFTCYRGDFSIKKIKIASADHMQMNLIYSGKEGDNVKFMYTEKIGNYTQLSHNVTYNIKQNNVIGYRGARIKIIECTNPDTIFLTNFAASHLNYHAGY